MNKRSTACGLLLTLGAAVHAAPAAVVDANGSSLEDRVTLLERMVAARKDAQLRIQTHLDDVQNEVDALRGDAESLNNQMTRMLERQRQLYIELSKLDDKLNQGPSQSGETLPASNEPAASLPVGNEASAYEVAVNLILKEKRYDDAVPAFQSFLASYPTSSYAPNAHYWLGQLLFNNQDWEGASEQFQSVITNYPDSAKRADALLKLGLVEQRRGNIARAQQLFQQVITEYPNSSSRKLAEARLTSTN